LVAEVSLAHVGIVFGLDISRLARSNRDWHHLLEVCALFGTLIGDLDGIYDPLDGGVSKVEIDGNTILSIKGIRVAMSTFETLPSHRALAHKSPCLQAEPISFASRYTYGPIAQHFRPRRHRFSAPVYRQEMQHRYQVWGEITGTEIAA
jgi:hypothetical protein